MSQILRYYSICLSEFASEQQFRKEFPLADLSKWNRLAQQGQRLIPVPAPNVYQACCLPQDPMRTGMSRYPYWT
ncbi:MAG TPA: hypothetical protein VFA09_14730 [Ktedonobacteraceae bacterium]|nr:hypothetical protein [Ktedonobacteraceae bacterium]